MKTFSFIVAVVVSVLVIGCQDNNQFNPISSDSHNAGAVVTKSNSSPDGVFELQTQLTFGNNESVDNTYDVAGQIQYTLVPGEVNSYTFSVVTSATLESGIKDATGSVYGESIEPVTIVGKDAVAYERVYKVSNLKEKEMDLHVQFTLTVEEVQVSNMWLSEPPPRGGFTKR